MNNDGDFPVDVAEGDRVIEILEKEIENKGSPLISSNIVVLFREGLSDDELAELKKKPQADFTKLVEDMIRNEASLDDLDEQQVAPVCIFQHIPLLLNTSFTSLRAMGGLSHWKHLSSVEQTSTSKMQKETPPYI